MGQGRKPNLTRPDHAALVGDVAVARFYGRDQPAIIVRCPKCLVERVKLLSDVRNAIRRGKFTGHCALCRPPADRRIWDSVQGAVSYRLRNGFVVIRREYARTPAHAVIWDQLAGQDARRNGNVYEHEFIMSCVIGRAVRLQSSSQGPFIRWRVAHRDGVRFHNHPNNLMLQVLDRRARVWADARWHERPHEARIIELYGNQLEDAKPGVAVTPPTKAPEAYKAPQGLAAAFGKLTIDEDAS